MFFINTLFYLKEPHNRGLLVVVFVLCAYYACLWCNLYLSVFLPILSVVQWQCELDAARKVNFDTPCTENHATLSQIIFKSVYIIYLWAHIVFLLELLADSYCDISQAASLSQKTMKCKPPFGVPYSSFVF